jgi:hypothetical protein
MRLLYTSLSQLQQTNYFKVRCAWLSDGMAHKIEKYRVQVEQASVVMVGHPEDKHVLIPVCC